MLVLIIVLLPIAVAFGGAASALLGKAAYKLVTGEDRLAEWLQVFFYSLAFVYALFVSHRLRKSGHYGMAALYFCLCAGFFFMLGEELSWGQRVAGWETPQVLLERNKQGESNLHNICGVGSTFKWIQLQVGAYGALLPILFWRFQALRRHAETLRWMIPHPTLIPYFAPLMIWRVFRNLFEVPDRFYFVVAEYSEVLELVLAMGFFLFMLFQLRTLQRETPSAEATRFAWSHKGSEPSRP
jgi:hypothetical protein